MYFKAFSLTIIDADGNNLNLQSIMLPSWSWSSETNKFGCDKSENINN